MHNKKINDKFIIKRLREDEKDYLFSVLDKKLFGNIKKEDTLTTQLFSIKTENDKTVGFFGLEQFQKDTLCICYLFIKPKFRRQHIATELLKLIAEENSDLLYIYGLVSKENENAIKFYSKNYPFLAIDRRNWTKNLNFAYLNDKNEYEVIFKC